MKRLLSSSYNFIRFIATHSRGLLWLSLTLSVLVSVTEGVGVLLLLPMLEAAGVDTEASNVGGVSEAVWHLLDLAGLPASLAPVLLLFLITIILHESMNWVRLVTNAKLDDRVSVALRRRLFLAVINTSWEFFCKDRQASLGKVLTQDVERTVAAIHHAEFAMVALCVAALYLLFALYISPGITVLVAMAGTLISVIVAYQLSRSSSIGRQTTHRYDRLYCLINDYLSAMKTVKSYGRVQDCVDRFDEANRSLGVIHRIEGTHGANMEIFYKIGAAVSLCAIVYTSVSIFGIPTADLLFLLVLFSRVMPKLSQLAYHSFRFANHVPSFSQAHALMMRCERNRDGNPNARRLSSQAPFSKGVAVESVTFAYDGGPPVLRDVSLNIAACSTTAIVGVSGSGKTTLIDLVMGLLRPSAGTVRVDGERLTPELGQALRPWVGYVGQDTVLFNANIRDNLLWAAPEADDDSITQALYDSRADFVLHLPKGLETEVGDLGILLSAGQRQRLSLARALLRKPRLLIMDEATNALDMENESHIMRTLEVLHGKMTILIVSHQQNVVREADVVYVLDGGEIVAEGTWAEVCDEARMRVQTQRERHREKSTGV
jgi:ATP-binding cassette subfamily C protein